LCQKIERISLANLFWEKISSLPEAPSANHNRAATGKIRKLLTHTFIAPDEAKRAGQHPQRPA